MARRHWLDVVIAPLRWVERARGWRRVALVAAYLVLALGVAGPLFREASLWRIPNIAEPVDRAKFGRINLPDADNAAVVYREAADLLTTRGSDHPVAQVVGGWGQIPTWSTAAPEVRRWVVANDAALGRWLRGTKRPDALFDQPSPDDGDQTWSVWQTNIRALAFLGMMAASRAEESGDLAGAWPYRLGVIRSMAHLERHADTGEAAFAGQVLRQATTQAQNWVDNDRQTGDLLRAACRDLGAVQSLLPTTGDLVRTSYFEGERQIIESGGHPRQPNALSQNTSELALLGRAVAALGQLLDNEPRRSLRIHRLITAGQLAQVDRPIGERATLVSGDYQVFEVDDHTPAPLRAIRPAALAALAESSGCRDYLIGMGLNFTAVRVGHDACESLLQHTAERAYALDHGNQAPATFGDLVPTYLAVLPEGIKASDPILAP